MSVPDGGAVCATLDTKICARVDDGTETGPAAVVIRPERIALTGADDSVATGRNVLRGLVRDIVYLGAATHVHVDLPGGETLTVEVANHDGPSSVAYGPGTTVQCVCTPDAVRVLRRATPQRRLPVDARSRRGSGAGARATGAPQAEFLLREAHRDPIGRIGIDFRVFQRDLDRQAVQQRTERERERTRVDAADLA